ncbi:integrase [Staphylococcus microti]|uniref:Integrase n=1 Tax=Staphylococcus microti TaxID=569857 RepID=A0A0D6XSK7_9STAP|nr:IS30 family transposase [Staphylococcus microti]KIX91226.1 integrase [Staphylococcus microti]SUM58298.1 truncated transposase [Staphylococcus microti]
MQLCIDPTSVKKREEYGHYEVDTIWSKRPSTACLLTIIERKTRFLYARRLNTRQSDVVCDAIVDILQHLSPKTITLDQGKEFSLYEIIEDKLLCDVYFSDAGKPYQRGSIENANGLLRQYFPKGTDFKDVSDMEVQVAVEQINTRPRMIFDYLTSEDMLFDEHN